MKLRHVFLLILVLFSVAFYGILFSHDGDFFGVAEEVLTQIFIFYSIIAFAILVYGLEGEKQSGGKAGELLFFAVAIALALVAKIYFSHYEHLLAVKVIALLYAFSSLPTMLIYETVHFVSKRVFAHDFEFAGKYEMFKRPADSLLTLFILLSGMGIGFLLLELLS